jgi:hypothetical protein
MLPGASVTVRNGGTDISQNATAGERGDFAVSHLSSGTYSVSVVQEGFKRFTKTDIVLATAARVRMDAVPGAQQGSGSAFSIGGTRGNQNQFTLDGTTTKSPMFGNAIGPAQSTWNHARAEHRPGQRQGRVQRAGGSGGDRQIRRERAARQPLLLPRQSGVQRAGGHRQRSERVVAPNVPTVKFRAGDFSSLLPGTAIKDPPRPAIHRQQDPHGAAEGCGAQDPGAVLPASEFRQRGRDVLYNTGELIALLDWGGLNKLGGAGRNGRTLPRTIHVGGLRKCSEHLL